MEEGGKSLLFLFVFKLNKYELWKLNEPSESRQLLKWGFRDHQVPERLTVLYSLGKDWLEIGIKWQ
jgi:hypothetical protein